MFVRRTHGPLLAHHAAESDGPLAVTRTSLTRANPARKPSPSDTSPLSLSDCLLLDAPGVMLIVDTEGTIRASSATARATWPRLSNGATRLHDIVDVALSREWLAHIHAVNRDHAPLALRGVVKGEWLWTILRPLEFAGTSSVLITIRPMTAEAIHTPPPGIDPSIRVVDSTHHDLGPLGQLSKREIEVLSLVGVGLTTGQIAKSLHRSLKTVENHRTSIGRKLNARSLLDLCRIARRAGMPESTPLFSERVHGKGESPMMDGK